MAKQTPLLFKNPATGKIFGQISAASPTAVQNAVDDMRHAYKTWGVKSPGERVWVLKQFKEYLIDHADEIAAVINEDCGKQMQDSLVEVFITVDNLSQMVKHTPRWLTRQRIPRGLYWFKRYYAERIPFGVVAVIGPWNYPFVQIMTPVLAALAAGNTVVIKGSEETAAVGQLIERLFAGFPEIASYVRVIHGGPEAGKALVEAAPDLVFVTGSVGTAQKIAAATSQSLTPLITELGGKDAMLVLEDADIAQAAKWGVWAANYHAGQVCMSVERVYVHEAVYEPFVAAVQAEIEKFKVGFSRDLNSPYNSGPLTTERQLEIVKDHVEDALDKGAKLVTGGRHEELFYEPTVLVDVNQDMKVIREESFGPIMPIVKVRSEEEAIRLANDSEYGLCAYVWSGNLARAERVGQKLEAGTIVVNDAMAHYAVSHLPFGGVKKSGSGRIHGREEVLQFTQVKGYAVGHPPSPFDVATVFRAPGHYGDMKRLMQLVFGSGRQKMEAIFPSQTHAATPAVPLPEKKARYNGLYKAAVVGGAALGAAALFAMTRKKS
ncbi:MAG: aldehyde dehydrogenase family protein [Ardenticatenaceae bacterium]|nr:aldehyde dehydrogenase family protein [Ardenticatenaceae bacterium]